MPDRFCCFWASARLQDCCRLEVYVFLVCGRSESGRLCFPFKAENGRRFVAISLSVTSLHLSFRKINTDTTSFYRTESTFVLPICSIRSCNFGATTTNRQQGTILPEYYALHQLFITSMVFLYFSCCDNNTVLFQQYKKFTARLLIRF